MSDFRSELAQSAAGLEATANAAMEALGLAPDGFKYLKGEREQRMYPQAVLPDIPDYVADCVYDKVTLYGDRGAIEGDGIAYGRIIATVNEPLPEGVTHQTGIGALPQPFIPRRLDVKDGIIEVDTPLRYPSLADDEGPLVVEGGRTNPRFRMVTTYNTATGEITVRTGRLVINTFAGMRRDIQDETVELAEADVDPAVIESRAAIVLRTLRVASSMFAAIASRNVQDVSWAITE